jgi:hypothetical protein
MHAARNELPIRFGAGQVAFRGVDWGDMRAMSISLPAGLDATPFLHGLPNDRCTCPHWGYVVKGRLRVISPDGEETYAAGDLYHMPPGHTFVVEDDAELVEFSPPGPMDEVGAVLRRNFAAAAQSADPSIRATDG